jgi:thiamine biosynthesis lipoprotein
MSSLSRRDFLKITAISGAGLVAYGVTGQMQRAQHLQLNETRSLMGTIVHLTVLTADESAGRTALESTFGEMERLINIFDHRRKSSPLTILNNQGWLDSAPAELTSVMMAALRYSALTDGAFDISVKPVIDRYEAGQMDISDARELVNYQRIRVNGTQITLENPGMAVTLDGIAKGFVVDGGVATLRRLGFTNVVVESGGDLVASGIGRSSEAWQVGIAHPRPERLAGYIARFSLRDQAVATSGDYLRYFTEDLSTHHIVDPRTGLSPRELASVSVVAPDATTADALSTALMVMPLDAGIALVNTLPQIEALFVSKDLRVRRTSGFPVV